MTAGVVNPVFGPIVLARDLEAAARTTLATWLPTYLREVERQEGIPAHSLHPIASEATVNAFASIQGLPKPCVVIVSPGTEGEPETRDGRYGFWWQLGIAVIVEAKNDLQAKYVADMYGAAILKLLVDKPSLGGIVTSLRPLSVRSDEIPEDLLQGGVAVCRIEALAFVDGVVTATGGPHTPSDNPAPWPTVETVHVDAERLT